MNNLRIKKTILCKHIDNYKVDRAIVKTYRPKAGDVALFEILKIGKHFAIQSETKRNVFLVEGDVILAGYGNRYATGQFEGYVPEKPTEFNDIIAIGGVVGILKSKNAEYKDIEPTKVRLLGYAVDSSGKVLNTRYYHAKKNSFTGIVPNNARVILSVGSSMDSGKTMSAAFLCRGLKTTGKNVAYIKFTGTTYTKDQDLAYDVGADVTLDFSDAGFPSTYMCSENELLDLYQTLLGMLEPHEPDYIVMEIADGLVQRETDFLLRSGKFMGTVSSIMMSCGDSLSAFYAAEYLTRLGFPPAALAGIFTMSPLLIEEVKAGINIPVLTIDELMSGQFVDLFTRQEVLISKNGN